MPRLCTYCLRLLSDLRHPETEEYREDEGRGPFHSASRCRDNLFADLGALGQSVEDLLVVAKTDEADGYVTAYHFQTGALHRLLGAVRGMPACAGNDRRPLREREARGVRVEVHVIGTVDEPLAIAQLMVNGFGVATWRAWDEVGRTGSTGRDYAEECARVLRKALGVVVESA